MPEAPPVGIRIDTARVIAPPKPRGIPATDTRGPGNEATNARTLSKDPPPIVGADGSTGGSTGPAAKTAESVTPPVTQTPEQARPAQEQTAATAEAAAADHQEAERRATISEAASAVTPGGDNSRDTLKLIADLAKITDINRRDKPTKNMESKSILRSLDAQLRTKINSPEVAVQAMGYDMAIAALQFFDQKIKFINAEMISPHSQANSKDLAFQLRLYSNLSKQLISIAGDPHLNDLPPEDAMKEILARRKAIKGPNNAEIPNVLITNLRELGIKDTEDHSIANNPIGAVENQFTYLARNKDDKRLFLEHLKEEGFAKEKVDTIDKTIDLFEDPSKLGKRMQQGLMALLAAFFIMASQAKKSDQQRGG